jgi:hypothetical protein
MSYIKPEPSPQAEWCKLIEEAQSLIGYRLEDHLQHYLMLTLDHYTQYNQLSSQVFALEYLNHTKLDTKQDLHAIRGVGDQCLVLSGLFPQRVLKKNVSLHYVIGMGKQAYHLISNVDYSPQYDAQLFHLLYENFVGLMDLLHHMRIDKQ